ncbi:papain-like cysteine protease family protein [Amycolatopsis sp. lyj-109]|uniref:papain-like cysteine protease family protein n=1 Tax=Amycolatopsis sp. lyj-109 TaxID=2789287 RepID=UPI00397D2C4F
MIDIPVTYIAQPDEHLCWYTALQMIVEYRRGAEAAVVGHPAALTQGAAQSLVRAGIRAQQVQIGISATRKALSRQPPRGLEDGETAEMAQLNGMREAATPAGGWTAASLEQALRDHGPLWCAIQHDLAATQHVVVVKGVNAAGQVVLHDPQFGPNLPWEVPNFTKRLLTLPNSVLYLPA